PGSTLFPYTTLFRSAVGAAREQMAQALINDQIARFNYAQQLPYNKLAQYMGLIQGNYGGTEMTTQPYDRRIGASMMSGAGTALRSEEHTSELQSREN